MRVLIIPMFCIISFFYANQVTGQQSNAQFVKVIQTKYLKKSLPLSQIKSNPLEESIVARTLKEGYHPKKDWPLHQKLNPDAKPNGEDPVLQKKYPPSNDNKDLELDFNGMGYSSVNPADPCIAVGPEHVVQMINGISGAYIRVYNKSGSVLQNNTYMDLMTGIGGHGDPIVLYDEIEDRWIMCELAHYGNQVILAVSATNNPLGEYHIYVIDTPAFPDYPKIAIWSDAYFMTTNEDGVSGIYALDKQRMLNGLSDPRTQRFTIPEFQNIGFQAATPVGIDGAVLPPANSPGLILRMADDGWDNSISQDRLELFECHVDFDDASNSYLSNPKYINTQPYDTELCGYTSFACVEQPNVDLNLDPLREVLMHKISYRNFGTHQSIVCTHVTDVDGNDRVGIRWYELRKSSTWGIHQQGTYAPNDGHSRWMAAIGINGDGAIGLAYNISSNSLYPSIRYTGRKACDVLGEMTYPETTIKDGESHSNSNRWGDYTTLAVDPTNNSFWYTAAYARGGSWKTHIAKFTMDNCGGISLASANRTATICSGEEVSFNFQLDYLNGYSGTTFFSAENVPSTININISNYTVNSPGLYTFSADVDESTPDGSYNITIKGTSGDYESIMTYTLDVEEGLFQLPQLSNPTDNAEDVSLNPTFDWTGMIEADSYVLEISKNPSINSTTMRKTNIQISEHTPAESLELNTTYYWRVHGIHECGHSPFSDIHSFTTLGQSNTVDDCVSDIADDLPLDITTVGSSVISSAINFPYTGMVEMVSIEDLDIKHTYVSDLTITLISPAGTEVILISKACSGTDNYYLNIDDYGSLDMPCPATTGDTYQPREPMNTFIGEQAQGNWTIYVRDDYNQDGGTFDGWKLNLCISSDGNLSNTGSPSSSDQESDCAQLISHASNVVPNGLHQASTQILSSGTILNNGDVNYRSGQDIDLYPGFEVLKGGIFEGKIADCLGN